MSVSKRYTLCKVGDNSFLLSMSSAKIIKALQTFGTMGYDALSRRTRIPVSSLYVFAKRLEKSRLISRMAVEDHDGTYTMLGMDVSAEFEPMKVVG